MNFEKCLTEHIKSHPALRPQDVIKFCYQATFGAEHQIHGDGSYVLKRESL